MKLSNASRQIILAAEVTQARSVYARMKGLLGQKSWPAEATLWIAKCNSIHTWFMRFPIDAVFVDKDLIVQKTCFNLPAWRITWPCWRSTSVFEFYGGTLSSKMVSKGDQLHVDC